MTLETGFELAFAAAVLTAVGSFALAAFTAVNRRLLVTVGSALALLAAAAWIVFAFDPGRQLAVSAAGIAVCAASVFAALVLAGALRRGRRLDQELAAADTRLKELVENLTADHAAELERALARARADSVSLLLDEERRIAEERREAVAEREGRARIELAKLLTDAKGRLDQRLASWTRDLEQVQGTLAAQVSGLGRRQEQLLSEAEARIESEARRLESEAETHRGAAARARAEVDQTAREAVQAAQAELEAHSAERRSALHEVGERLRRRERELHEQIEREENEAAQRIRATFADTERRQIEQLGRVVERTTASQSEAAAQRFEEAIKTAREGAAQRLARELDRAVQMFTRETQSALAERLAHLGDAGAQRLEKRLGQIAAGLERQRDEIVADLQRSAGETEAAMRRQLEALRADTEAERGILEARLHELSRRIEDVVARSQERLPSFSSAGERQRPPDPA